MSSLFKISSIILIIISIEFRNIFAFSAKFAYTASIAILFSVQALCNPMDTLISAKDTIVKIKAESAKKTNLYRVNYYISGSIIGVGAIADYFAIARIKGKADITDVELNTLNSEIFNSIDRWALNQDVSQRKTFGNISDYLEVPFILLPTLLALDKKIKKEWLDLLTIYVEGHIVTFTFYNYSWFGPAFQNKYRPLTYYPEIPMSERKDGGNRNSFYSGHTASVAFSTFFMAKVYCDYHPEMGFGYKFLLYTAAFVPPAVIGYLRVGALKHFPSDNLVGITLGAALGIIIPELHKYRIKNLRLGMFDVPGGMGLSVCWKLP